MATHPAAAPPPPTPHSWLARSAIRALNRITALLRLLRYAYLMRVPILIAAVLVGFPFAALLPGSPMRELFQNLFLLGTGSALPTFFSTVAALVLA